MNRSLGARGGCGAGFSGALSGGPEGGGAGACAVEGGCGGSSYICILIVRL